MAVRRPELAAGVLGLTAAIILIVVWAVDPPLADRLTRENETVEWLQVALFALGAALALGAAWKLRGIGASPVLEILVAAMLMSLIIGEVDLDRVVTGHKIIHTLFFVDARVPLGWRVVAGLVLVVPPIALAFYAFVRRVELIAATWRAVGTPWGRTFVAGVFLFGVTEVFERPLGHVVGLPKYMAEESLELISAIWMAVGAFARLRALRNGAMKP